MARRGWRDWPSPMTQSQTFVASRQSWLDTHRNQTILTGWSDSVRFTLR
jgi:hypothetical protein